MGTIRDVLTSLIALAACTLALTAFIIVLTRHPSNKASGGGGGGNVPDTTLTGTPILMDTVAGSAFNQNDTLRTDIIRYEIPTVVEKNKFTISTWGFPMNVSTQYVKKGDARHLRLTIAPVTVTAVTNERLQVLMSQVGMAADEFPVLSPGGVPLRAPFTYGVNGQWFVGTASFSQAANEIQLRPRYNTNMTTSFGTEDKWTDAPIVGSTFELPSLFFNWVTYEASPLSLLEIRPQLINRNRTHHAHHYDRLKPVATPSS